MAGELYPNLPGVIAAVQDGGLRVSRPTNAPKVTLLGVTDKVDVGLWDPYLLSRKEDATLFETSAGTPSEISQAIEEAQNGGAQNIEVMIIDNTVAITDSNRFTALATAYNTLINTRVDIVCPLGCYIDTDLSDATKNFGYQLGDFCYHAMVNNTTVRGAIGTEPVLSSATGIPTLSEVDAHVTALAAYDTSGINGVDFSIFDGTTDANGDGVPDNYAFIATSDRAIPTGSPPSTDGQVLKDDHGNFIDIGALISVVAGDYLFANESARRLYPSLGYYRGTAAVAYAGLDSKLPTWQGTTNQVLGGVRPARPYSLTQANTLVGARMVCLIDKPGGFKVAKGITGAYNISQYYKSDFTNLSTVKIAQGAINLIRLVCDPFVGLPMNQVNLNSMETAIDGALHSLQSTGALNGYDFSLVSMPSARVLGNMTVDVKLDIAIEINRITVKIGLTPPEAIGT